MTDSKADIEGTTPMETRAQHWVPRIHCGVLDRGKKV